MFTNAEEMLAVYREHLATTLKHQRALDSGALGSSVDLMVEVLSGMCYEKAGMTKVLGLSNEEYNALQVEVESTLEVETPAQ